MRRQSRPSRLEMRDENCFFLLLRMTSGIFVQERKFERKEENNLIRSFVRMTFASTFHGYPISFEENCLIHLFV